MSLSITPVILSGGSGTRLWPYSRAMYPKQLLPLAGEKTMLQETILRIRGGGTPINQPIIICNETHRFLVAQQLHEIGSEPRIILEPEGRNTAPAACLAAILEEAEPGDRALLILPADHIIRDDEALRKAIDTAVECAGSDSLVTFGVVPDSPHTGYGYIKSGADTKSGARSVEEFVEKPNATTAQGYLDSGEYFWNSGMFLFPVAALLQAANDYARDILDVTRAAMKSRAGDSDFIRPDAEIFRSCRSDSIDYAFMEHTDKGLVVPLDAGWSDVGSWSALKQALAADDNGNVLQGDVVQIDCDDCFLSSESRMVAAAGLKDCVVIETKDAVLVTTNAKAEQVKDVVDQLRKQDRPEVDFHRQVFRPWGSYDSIDSGERFQVKRLIVNPGAVLSLQMHHHRAEHWVVVKGKARITLNDDEFDLSENESTYIPIGAKHRIANPFEHDVHIIEVQSGGYLGEDDIVRFEDQYGREGTNT